MFVPFNEILASDSAKETRLREHMLSDTLYTFTHIGYINGVLLRYNALRRSVVPGYREHARCIAREWSRHYTYQNRTELYSVMVVASIGTAYSERVSISYQPLLDISNRPSRATLLVT